MRAHPEACASFRPGGYLSESLEPLCGRCGLRARNHRRPQRRRRSRRRIFPSPYAPRRKAGPVHALLAPPVMLFAGWGVLHFLAEIVRLAP